MANHYGVSEIKFDNGKHTLDVFLYDTLDTVQQNIPKHAYMTGVPPLVVVYNHLFTSLRGVFLAEPGDRLHMRDGSEVHLYKHVVLVDRYFYTSLKRGELDALIAREEVLYSHVAHTGNDHALRFPREYCIVHDTEVCRRGVEPLVFLKALEKSKLFEYQTTVSIFGMNLFDRVLLKTLYIVQNFQLFNRNRKKNLHQLHKHRSDKPTNDAPFATGQRSA